MSSGFVLAVPVFFDTVFYLLVPLARSMHRRTGRHYLKYLMAIAAGAGITHTLVPPTPGPLIMADNLNIDLGVMILVGAVVALPTAFVGLWVAGWLDRRLDLPMRPIGDRPDPDPIVQTLAQGAAEGSGLHQAAGWTALIGNANLALLVATVVALFVYVRQRSPSKEEMADVIEGALMSGGVIILITAGGGAFGAMLKEAQIGPAIQGYFTGGQATGIPLLFVGFFVAALLKFAQGSSAVAMITASAMLATMVTPETLGMHPVYLATAIGGGSLVGSWMNDSGFWIIAKMGGLTEVEALKTWTPLVAILGVTAMVCTLILALVFPMAG
jgi:GntP family gluconate:H+ symporter